MEMSNGGNKLGEEEEEDEDEYEDEYEDEDEDEGRRVVTVCVPPKNALLLMRCRSDPMKMAALSRRLLESPVSNAHEPVDNNVHKDADFEDPEPEWCSQPNANLVAPVIGVEGDETEEAGEDEQHFDVDESGMIEELEEESEQGMEEPQEEMEDWLAVEKEEEDNQRDSTTLDEEDDTQIDSTTMKEEEQDIKRDSTTMEEEEEVIKRDDSTTMEEEEEEEKEMNEGYLSGNEDEQKFIGEEKKEEEVESVPALSDLAIESPMEMENVEEEKAANESEEEDEEEEEEEETYISLLWPEDDPAQSEREMPSSSPSPLPDCLLLMMGEPKVSMEVSKETWVCTTDFIRFLPERRRPGNKALAGVDEPEKKDHTIKIANTNASRPKPELKQAQPPRSSCSIPGKAAPVLTAQKLPRCKSEPMRTAAAKLVPPETCLWKAEPLSRATVGVGSAAGVGF